MTSLGKYLRYARRLPPRMIAGRARQEWNRRVLIHRIWRSYESGPSSSIDFDDLPMDELRSFASVYEKQGARFASHCLQLNDATFVSNGRSHSFPSVNETAWGSVLDSDETATRWEHDLAFFAYAMPLVSRSGAVGVETLSIMTRALERQNAGGEDLRRFHWSPIALALRVMSLASAVALIPAADLQIQRSNIEALLSHISACTSILEVTVERYLGYNHAVFTEAGLAIGLLVQGRVAEAKRSADQAIEEVLSRTLPDGAWSERSPAYHIHMMLILSALLATGIASSSVMNRGENLLRSMRDALATMVHPDGEIAIFNDAAVGDAVRPAAVGWTAADSVESSILRDGGYARLVAGAFVTIMDAGPMGPRDVVGHGHADFLAIELSYGTHRLIVDPGVRSIHGGELRERTRAAAEHNGPVFLGIEPAEFFGTWRVGWSGEARFEGVLLDDQDRPVEVVGVCTGYERWNGSTSRRVRSEGGVVWISDTWTGASNWGRQSSFLVPKSWSLVRTSNTDARFEHMSGACVELKLSAGTIASITDDTYCMAGPSSVSDAHRVTLAPADDVVVFSLTDMVSP